MLPIDLKVVMKVNLLLVLFYMNDLPKWITDFNNSGKVDGYLNEVWDTYYDISTYTETQPDNNEFEGLFEGKRTPTFVWV